jgi:hypothetical protein
MAFTHVYRAMEIAPLTVIPYKPKLQKPAIRNVHTLPSKPCVRQSSSLNASQGIDSGESPAETSPECSWLVKNAEDCRVAAGNAVGPVNDPKSAEGTHLDRLFPSNRLNLTIYIGPARHANALAERNDSDDNSDDEFPSVRRLLSPEYRQTLVEKASLVQEDTAEKTVGEAMDDLFGFASIAGSSQGGCAELRHMNASSYLYR